MSDKNKIEWLKDGDWAYIFGLFVGMIMNIKAIFDLFDTVIFTIALSLFMFLMRNLFSWLRDNKENKHIKRMGRGFKELIDVGTYFLPKFIGLCLIMGYALLLSVTLVESLYGYAISLLTLGVCIIAYLFGGGYQ
ncbi:MAG: hypothetical protein V3U92_19765 [Cellulophaga sp.]